MELRILLFSVTVSLFIFYMHVFEERRDPFLSQAMKSICGLFLFLLFFWMKDQHLPTLFLTRQIHSCIHKTVFNFLSMDRLILKINFPWMEIQITMINFLISLQSWSIKRLVLSALKIIIFFPCGWHFW